MKKKIVVLMLSAAMTMSMMTGCGNTAKDDSASTTTETTQDAEATEEAEPTEEATEEATDDSASDQEAADKVAALIDQIYVQERNDNTDEQCKEAKEAWDALTDAQKELISGEEQDDQSCRPVEGQSRGATQQQVPPVEWAEHFGGEPCRSVLDDEHVSRLITE